MSKTSTQPLSQKKVPTKLVMGLMVAAVTVLVSTASSAMASPGNSGNGYGGNSGGGINLDLSGMLGDNNVIVIIINYFVGQ